MLWIGALAAFAFASPAPPPKQAFDLQTRRKHWAWQPVKKPPIPAIRRKDWPQNPIDNFILAKLEAKGLKPAPPADKYTLLRRVTYDLIGLPPTPEEIHAFLADHSSDAYRKVVDRLLASPHYGERWARHWLDLVRYAETDGHEFDGDKPGAYQYRDYVIRALNADLSYDQFVREQVAGDLLPHPRLHPTEHFNESMIGTGFFWLGEAAHSPVDLRVDEAERIDNQIDVFGKAFLGLGVGCARCHDHKFDAISTRDYYALFGYLKSSRYQIADIHPPLSADLRRKLAANTEALQRALVEETTRMLSSAANPRVALTGSPGQTPSSRQGLDSLRALLALLSAEPASSAPAEFAARRERVLKRLRETADRARQQDRALTLFEDFHAPDAYRRWVATGGAFGSAPTQTPRVRLAGESAPHIAGVVGPGMADSGALSEHLRGVLRSRTFTIRKSKVLYHMAGRDGQVRLIVDGYQRIRDPIYGGLSLPVNSDEMRWFTQNVDKWIGHRAYIEIVDDGPGFIAVDRIAFSEDAAPVAAPNMLLLKLLEKPSATSFDAFAREWSALVAETVAMWRSGSLATAPDAADRLALLNAALETLPPSALQLPAPLGALCAQRRSLEAQIPAPARAIAMADGTGEDAHIYIRGNPRSQGDLVPRRFLEACSGLNQPAPAEGSGRLALAQRMTAPSDPLLARVMVNRLWQHHFGEGIVRTPDDFGARGQPPTHPELLDWLASTFVTSAPHGSPNRASASSWNTGERWSLKKMHRLMVLSAAYRMSSRGDARAEAADPQNRLLHRMPVRRLEAECIRDAILAVSGRLDTTLYGPSVLPYLTPFMEGRGKPAVSGPLDGDGRRSLYISVRRNFLTPLFLAFDYPVPFSTMGRRMVSNVPAQALALMNNPFVAQQSALWAKRELQQPGPSEPHIAHLYEAAFGRLPEKAETEAALAFLVDQDRTYGSTNDPRSWSDLCHVLFNVKEFLFVN
jgi:hypothetical protein